jgi:hypothetical protein
MRSLGEDQPDPHGSPGGQTVQPILNDLGGFRVHAPDLLELWSNGFELLEAGDLRILQSLSGPHGQEQTIEGIIRVLRGRLRHRHASLAVDQGMRRRGVVTLTWR